MLVSLPTTTLQSSSPAILHSSVAATPPLVFQLQEWCEKRALKRKKKALSTDCSID